MSGHLLIIVGTSGTGKSTLIKKLKDEFSSIVESVSYTTRGMRAGEVHGQSYFFISIEEFEKMRDANEFLEWAQVHNNYYGTGKKFVEKQLSQGKDLLFDLDVQGADSFKKAFGEKARVIFIAPPEITVLESRLRKRGTDSTQVINVRLENAKKEILRKNDYDYLVVNDEFERAYSELRNIVESELKK